MRKLLLGFALVIPICLLTAAAQERPALTALPNTVFVGADGKYESVPDTAVMQFSISAQEETSGAAYDRASRNAEQIRSILKSNGVDPKTAEIGFFSMQPVYDWRTAKRKLVGYRVNTSVTLKLHDFSKVGPIMQQLADADISDNQSLNYSLEKIDEAKQKAVEDAFRRARESAATVARAGGRTLGELSYASVDTFAPVVPVVMPRVMAMAEKSPNAAPAPTEQFSAQNIVVTAHVNTMFTLK